MLARFANCAVLGIVGLAAAATAGTASACDYSRCVTRFVPVSYTVPVSYSVPVAVVQPAPRIAPVAFVQRPQLEIPAGATLAVGANFLGAEPGFVLLRLENAVLKAEVRSWGPTGVVVKLPDVGVNEPLDARIEVLLPTGRVVKSTPIRLIQRSEIVVVDEQRPAIEPTVSFPESTAGQPSTGGLTLSPRSPSTIPASTVIP